MLQVFADDSGSSNRGAFFAVGGLIANVAQWEAFSDEWKASLDRDGLPYFKASEANALEGTFRSGWSRPLVEQKAVELAEIAARHAQFRIHVLIRLDEFSAYVKSVENDVGDFGSEWRNPYFLCYFTLGARLARYCNENGISEDREFIFDEQGVIGENAAKIIGGLLDNPIIKAGFGGIPSFKNDKRALPLQAADLYTWNIRDYVEKGSVVPKSHISVKRTLFDLPAINFMVTTEILGGLRAQMYAKDIMMEAVFREAGLSPPWLK